MVRVRGKSKKRSDHGSGGEDKNRGRGRPQKPVKDEESEKTTVAAEENKIEEPSKAMKRKRSLQVGESMDSAAAVEENGGSSDTKSSTTTENSPTKFVGFRHIGSRRKNKPHRAAEVGVECK